MIARVTNVTGSGSWTHPQYGDFNKFEYTFDDGVTITANHKVGASPFPVGDEVEYIVTKENEYGKQGKVKKPESESPKRSSDKFKADPDKMASIEKQVALKEANHYHATHGFNTDEPLKEVIETAQYFYSQYLSK